MASRLVVAKGKTVTIDDGYPEPLVIDELVMEDGARIDLQRDLEMHVTQSVTIGKNCLIEASGLAGLDGSDAVGVPPQAPQVTPGTTGYPGSDGKRGTRGWNIKLIWGITSIDDCLIRSNGGKGGDGGNGGAGGQGGGATCLGGDGRPGGDGGRGGRGGRGGDSGRIELTWYSANFAAITKTFESDLGISGLTTTSGIVGMPLGLRLEANAGNGGGGGNGGPGARGGDGVNCGFYGKGGGPNGNKGPDGRGGSNGEAIVPRVRLG